MAGPPRRERSRLPLVGGLCLLVLAVAAAARATSDGSGEPAPPLPTGGVEAATVTRAPATPPAPGHEVYGYVPYWEMDAGIAEHVAATDLSTLALFSVTQRRDGALADENGWRAIDGPVGQQLLAEAHARGLRVELVWSSFGSDKNRAFFSDRAVQDRWLTELVELVAGRGFDGVNVDVEGLPAEHVPGYGGFVGRLREALRTARPDAEVSVATGASELGAAMAAAAAANGADRIFLMGYDYRTAGSAPGASAPLDRTDGGEKDLAWSLDAYAQLRVPPERTLLGLPLYGMTWPVVGDQFGAAAVDRGEPWIPRRHASALNGGAVAPTLDPTEQVEFFALERGDRWDAVYYDSPRSLQPKLALANDRGLAGVGFWAIGYERGLPGYRELIAEFAAGE
jgi:spore germination protein YaaH